MPGNYYPSWSSYHLAVYTQLKSVRQGWNRGERIELKLFPIKPQVVDVKSSRHTLWVVVLHCHLFLFPLSSSMDVYRGERRRLLLRNNKYGYRVIKRLKILSGRKRKEMCTNNVLINNFFSAFSVFIYGLILLSDCARSLLELRTSRE